MYLTVEKKNPFNLFIYYSYWCQYMNKSVIYHDKNVQKFTPQNSFYILLQGIAIMDFAYILRNINVNQPCLTKKWLYSQFFLIVMIEFILI